MTRDASTQTDAASPTVEAFFNGSNNYTRGCFVCGAEATIMVQIRAMEQERGRHKKGGRSKSVSRTFCIDHAEIYTALADQLVSSR